MMDIFGKQKTWKDHGKILIVEDSKVVRTAFAALLLKEGYTVEVAECGAKADELIRVFEPHVVLLDWMMPDVDGIDLLSMWHGFEELSWIPVIMLTAKENTAEIEKAFEQGAFDYVTKPPSFKVLLARIRNAVNIYRLQQRLRDQIIRDPLTNVHNRRYFMDRMNREIERSRRYKRELSLVMLDIDHFKKINDVHGHQTGDATLKLFGKVVSDTVRTCDIVCRIGGEEFVIVCPECSAEQAERAVERIRENMEKCEWRNSAGELMPTVTFSAGVTETGEDIDFDTLVREADSALYESKKMGRNQTSVFKKISKRVS